MLKKQSEYLLNVKDKVKKLVTLLEKDYEYASVLATDVGGTSYQFSQRQHTIAPYMFAERGFVARVYHDGGYQEYSFNEIGDVEQLANKIVSSLKLQQQLLEDLKVEKYETPLVHEEEICKEFAREDASNVGNVSRKEIMDKLKKCSDEMMKNEGIIEAQIAYNNVDINKMYISSKKDMIQTYGYSVAQIAMIGLKDGKTNMAYDALSGFKGVEIIDEIYSKADEVYQNLMCLFDAENVVPGEYTVICPPSSTGIIAHEAFGHGLEMDMFVKERAVAKYHMGEKIGSDITDMYDGVEDVDNTASYWFDDEGTIAHTTTIMKDGYLLNGMTDLLSALRLDVIASGNGRRETYKRKAYTRMTNTYFGTGSSTLEEMIASTDYGFLIDGAESGMEDPKHWGIQCVLSRAKEIKDGKLTGKVFTPVILTGYVPDLLANVSMTGNAPEYGGAGYCGKGYKEWVVVSDGGPYIKTKVRLG